jgi:uncharacterized protein (DUF1330 family)
MAAYLISEAEVLDYELLEIYRKIAAESIQAYGGRYLVCVGASELVEGGPPPKGLVIVEFPNMEVAKQWYNSPAYAQALKVSGKALSRRLVFVEGVAP